VVLAFRRGSDSERTFWQRTLERGEMADPDLDHAQQILRGAAAAEILASGTTERDRTGADQPPSANRYRSHGDRAH
jgi:hypothetical protein